MTLDNTVDGDTWQINRRTILRGVGATTAVGLIGTPAFAGLARAEEHDVDTCGLLDIVCAIDTSGSLSTTERDKLEDGVNQFISSLPGDGSVLVGTLEFGDGGVRNRNALQDPSGLTVSLGSPSGNTPMPAALDIADQAVYGDSAARDDAVKLVVVFTDGGPNYGGPGFGDPRYTLGPYMAPRDDSTDWSAASNSPDPAKYDNADTEPSTVSKPEMDETALVAASIRSGLIGGGATSIATVYVGDDDTEAMTAGAEGAYDTLPDYMENEIASSSDFAIDVLPENVNSLVTELLEILAELCPCEALELDLCAGQDINVGTVSVNEVDGDLTVTYDLNEPWVLCESHVDIGDEKDDLHTNRPGNPRVGRFDLSRTYDPCVSSDTYTVACGDDALSDVDFDEAEMLTIAVHGVVRNTESGDEETAWVCGDQDGVSRFVPRGNWATYFMYDLCGEVTGLDCVSEE